MSESRYCEPCERFLRGDIIIKEKRIRLVISKQLIFEDVVFEHHRSFQSIDAALRLPCTICSRAWKHAKYPSSESSWRRLLGFYGFFEFKRNLGFVSEGGHSYESDRLALEPWPSE
jgi:hypothetical protein